MNEEIEISGICISKNVLATIVNLAVEQVEGVAATDGKNLASNLISIFSRDAHLAKNNIEASVTEDDKLVLRVHVAVFFGYPFQALAQEVRQACAVAISEQIGLDVDHIDVCIDELVFPKE